MDIGAIWDIFFTSLFFGSFYIFIRNPLMKRYQAPSWVDPLAGFILILISGGYFYFSHLSEQMIAETDKPPCAKMSMQTECYNLNETMCQAAWASSHGDCDDRLAKILKTRPSFLSGKFLDSCIGRNFDKIMHYNRKNRASLDCQNYFNKIDQSD